MQGIGDLPVELLISITDQISRKDALNLRLSSPRNILPFIDAIVFREIYLPIDASDDLERRKLENEKEGVALQRLIDVSQSRIVKLVRVLILRVARPYSLVGALGIFLLAFSATWLTGTFVDKRFGGPFPPTAVNNVTQRATSSIQLVKPIDLKTVKPKDPSTQISTTHLPKRDYAAELAEALRSLLSAADVVETIRLAQSSGYHSPQDIVYPTVYGRALTRLFDALLGVTFARTADTTLEIHDCPLLHLQESGLSLDEKIVEKVAAKFSRLSLETRRMDYILDSQATQYPQLGRQLVDGLRASGDHLTSLSLRGTHGWTPMQFIVSEDNYPSLTHIALVSIWISSAVFVPFISSRLPQLISLQASDIHFVGEGIRWQEAFDVWRAIKKSVREQGKDLKLEHLTFAALHNSHDSESSRIYQSWVPVSAISAFVKDILPPVVGYRGFR